MHIIDREATIKIVILLVSFVTIKPHTITFADNTYANILSEHCVKTFIGTIGKQYHYQMHLQREGDKLFGSYFYKKYPNGRLWLEGTIENDGTFWINEYVGNMFDELPNGRFEGQFLSWDTVEGMWSDAHKTRSYRFSMTCKSGVEKEKTTDNISFQIRRESKESHDLIKIQIEGEEEITLGPQCRTFLSLPATREWFTDVNLFFVQKINETPRLYHIEWQALPEGFFKITTYCFYIVAGGDSNTILLNNCFDERGEDWKDKYNILRSSWVHYIDNHLLVHDHYTDSFWKDGEVIDGEDIWVDRTYEITQDRLILIEAKERRKKNNALKETVLPLQEALKKYPAIQETMW